MAQQITLPQNDGNGFCPVFLLYVFSQQSDARIFLGELEGKKKPAQSRLDKNVGV